MCLSDISSSNKEEEKKITAKIFEYIDKNKSIIFSSGAGSGKTYTLIESLKYIIKKYKKELKSNNQKVICITYTNVAAEEVKERLGKTDLVKVSTIHERIWELIKSHQKELVEIHKEKLNEEIRMLNDEVKNNPIYSNLRYESKRDLKKKMLDKREIYKQNYDKNAKDFRSVFKDDMESYPNILKNVSKFKKLINTLYDIEDYNTCLEDIKSKKVDFISIKYEPIFNRDQLHKMLISHDTLLDYGVKIIKKYNALKQIIIDQYPYILIDEYQDTDEKIVEIMKLLSDYSVEIKHNLFIGYFGDAAQNIYDKGVGCKIKDIHLDLESIDKKFNRRSTKEVIDVINKIRKDKIEQVSIFDDCRGGSVKFFYTGDKKNESRFRFIEKYKKKWNITSKKQLHCLVLTNKTVAEFTGFKSIYDSFKETEYYKKNYDQLNTELLSNDLSKLGNIPKLIFRIIDFKNNLKNSKTPITKILSGDLYKDMNICDLREFIELLKSITGETLDEYVYAITKIYSQKNNFKYKEKYKKLINKIFSLEDVSSDILKSYLLKKLYPNLEDNKSNEANSNIQTLLDINLSEYDLWYNFILNKQKNEVIYHTYHGTKGLEFENIIIIMENAFGKDKHYFDTFFSNFKNSDNLGNDDKKKFEQKQNLLYVSCSRAIRNLRILYLDDISNFRNNLEDIFGKIFHYQH